MIICKFPSNWRQIFEKLQRMKFLRIEISYDCVVIDGYRTRTKRSYVKLSFHHAAICSWLRICMFKSKDRIVVSTEPIFSRCRQNDTPDCKFVMVKKTLCLADCKTGFGTKNVGSFVSCLGIAVNKSSPGEPVPQTKT